MSIDKRGYMEKYMIRNGFTLAEVLITLGVIGIVAALTIPNVTYQYRKKVVETRLAKFYSSINQAVQMSEKDNGPKEYWDALSSEDITDEEGNPTGESKTNSIEWFNKYLKPYMKILQIKEGDNFEDKAMVYFPDGSLLVFSASSFLFYPEAKDYEQYVKEDTSLKDRNREDCGVKYFTFLFNPSKDIEKNKYHYKRGVEPYKNNWDGTIDQLKNDGNYGCKQRVSNERAYCTALIQQNGWKIPDDYPLRF